jgi:hypothetical protein
MLAFDKRNQERLDVIREVNIHLDMELGIYNDAKSAFRGVQLA